MFQSVDAIINDLLKEYGERYCDQDVDNDDECIKYIQSRMSEEIRKIPAGKRKHIINQLYMLALCLKYEENEKTLLLNMAGLILSLYEEYGSYRSFFLFVEDVLMDISVSTGRNFTPAGFLTEEMLKLRASYQGEYLPY